MKEVTFSRPGLSAEAASFLACVATILELREDEVPDPSSSGDPSTDWNVVGWLGSLGIGLVPVASPNEFAWPGPWIARVQDGDGKRRAVVMYGRSPSGVVWDPAGGDPVNPEQIQDGFVIAAEDIALGMPHGDAPPVSAGSVERIWAAPKAGVDGRGLQSARLIPGAGVEGDRYVDAHGTFPSGRPGSALTLIEAEVCESFHPPLTPEEHRRNLVTRGVRLNGMVGREFTIGSVRCRGVRLCEPCATMQRYADRAILRALVHRGGLRADVLEEGEIHLRDRVALVD
jgi:hypothetical protein